MIKEFLSIFFDKEESKINDNTTLGDLGFTEDLADNIKTSIFNEYGVELSCDLFKSTTISEIAENFNKEMGNDISLVELTKITRKS